MTTQIIIGDALEKLKTLPDQSVHCCITSPPYWGLRDYNIPPTIWDGRQDCNHQWDDEITAGESYTSNGRKKWQHTGGRTDEFKRDTKKKSTQGQFCIHCHAWRGNLGLEPTHKLYVQHITAVFAEVHRVLRNDGTLWLNMGDSYASASSCNRRNIIGNGSPTGDDRRQNKLSGTLKEKSLCGMPWRVALALQDAGWILRSDIIWHKPNPMPESVTDRPTKAHEYVFLLAKQQKYYYDAHAIRETSTHQNGRAADFQRTTKDHLIPGQTAVQHRINRKPTANTGTRNRRSVWTIPTRPFPEAHFATFPPDLVEPCIKAGTSEHGVCPSCGAPWHRITKKEFIPQPDIKNPEKLQRDHTSGQNDNTFPGWAGSRRGSTAVSTTAWQPSCTCQNVIPNEREESVPATILDPFAGAGTTGLVADRLNRSAILIELNPKYAKLIKQRIKSDAGWTAELVLSEAKELETAVEVETQLALL
jgi:DNA modification methylase